MEIYLPKSHIWYVGKIGVRIRVCLTTESLLGLNFQRSEMPCKKKGDFILKRVGKRWNVFKHDRLIQIYLKKEKCSHADRKLSGRAESVA